MAKPAKKARRRPKAEPQVPPYVSMALIGKACGISKYRARTLVERSNILVRIGQRYYAGQSRQREELPEVFGRVFEYIVLSGDDEGSE